MGIVALIAVPMIKDTIYSSREKAFKNSALGLIRSANEYYLNSKLTGESFDEIEFKVSNGKMVSGNKELVFNGKVPVGNSYVKIKSNGDVAINITDGEFYAVKDYDEIGVSTGTSEETALLREEIAKELAELKLKVESNTNNINSNKNELNDKINSNKAELETKINSNFDKIYPVGSIYISTSSTNPSTIYGGTWERYAQGKTLVSVNESETEFSTVNKTGGEKTHTLTVNEMPSHNHSFTSSTEVATNNHRHLTALAELRLEGQWYLAIYPQGNYEVHPSQSKLNSYITYWKGTDKYDFVTTGDNSSASEMIRSLRTYSNTSVTKVAGTTDSNGSSSAHNNLQPYITVYMWKRTA